MVTHPMAAWVFSILIILSSTFIFGILISKDTEVIHLHANLSCVVDFLRYFTNFLSCFSRSKPYSETHF